MLEAHSVPISATGMQIVVFADCARDMEMGARTAISQVNVVLVILLSLPVHSIFGF